MEWNNENQDKFTNYEDQDSNPADIFHHLSVEEAYIKSNLLKDFPTVLDITLNPKSATFNRVSKPFLIKEQEYDLTFIGFSHNSSIEIYLDKLALSTESHFCSISIEIILNSKRYYSLLVTSSSKKSYLLQKTIVEYPLHIILKARYENNHTILFNKLLEKEIDSINQANGVLNETRLGLILQSSELKVQSEDKVLLMVGAWSDQNFPNDEILSDLLSLVRWTFITLNGIIDSLKYVVLKSSPIYKKIFKRELVFISGASKRNQFDPPRKSYKAITECCDYNKFTDKVADCLFLNYCVLFI